MPLANHLSSTVGRTSEPFEGCPIEHESIVQQNDVIKCLVVGLGEQATRELIPALKNSGKFRIAAVCDVDGDRLAPFQGSEIVCASSLSSLPTRDLKIGAVVLALPHDQYLPTLLALPWRDCAILKEKPLARNVREAADVLAAVRLNRASMLVAMKRRFAETYEESVKSLSLIGPIHSFDGHISISESDPSPTDWRQMRDQSGGGALLDIGYHLVDLMLWHFGMPTTVEATDMSFDRGVNVEHSARLLVRYLKAAPAITGTLSVSRRAQKSEALVIAGAYGTIRATRDELLVTCGNEVKRRLHRPYSAAVAVQRMLSQFRDGRFSEDGSGAMNHTNHVAIVEAGYESWRRQRPVSPAAVLRRDGFDISSREIGCAR